MEEFRNRINLVIVGRTVLSSVIIFTINWTHFFKAQYELEQAFYYLLFFILAVNVLFIFLNKLPAKYNTALIYSHLACDFFVASFIVFSTGVSDNPFFLLYIFIITYSSLFLNFSGILIVTALSCACIVSINFIYFFIFSTSQSSLDALKTFIFSVEINVLGYSLVGLLTGFLSDRLKKTRIQMAQQSNRIQDLKDYNEYILSSLRSGLITTDTNCDIVKANDMGIAILNLENSRILGRNALNLFQVSSEKQQKFHAESPEKRTLRIEEWIRFSDSPAKYVGASVSPLIKRGSVVMGYIFTFQDLTEIKKLQDEITIQKKMAAIGNFSAALAHEIRNPLASMMGSIQVLKNQATLNDSQHHLMDIVLRESHRLERIVSNFLEFAGSSQFKPRNIELLKLVEETVMLFQNSVDFKNSHRVHLSTDIPAMPFYGDPDQVKQVLWNLCSNAIKAMPTGGSLSIHCARDDTCFIIAFSDEGKGMDGQEIQNLFEPFYSQFTGGVGLGMAIVYRIVSDHGGNIDVQSRPGSGTVIRIFLPKNKEATQE